MIRAFVPFLLLASQAHAHDSCVGCDSASIDWDSRAALALLSVFGVVCAVGLCRIWRRSRHGRAIRAWRAACFAAGLAIVLLAYASPLHAIGERLFVAHMLEHEMLMVVAAPLLALSRPFGPLVWGLPARWRRRAGKLARWPGFALLAGLGMATVLHGAAIWVWHVPSAYEAAIASPAAHWLQHVSLLGTAILFWHAIVRSGSGRQGVAVFCLFATALHTGLLGILLTLGPTPLFAGQSAAGPEYGLTPLEDQQLAGIVMWVPGGMVYAAAALVLAALWIHRSAPTERKGARFAPA